MPTDEAVNTKTKVAILVATALSLLSAPLVSAGMQDIARDFANQAMTDPVAIVIMSLLRYLPGEVDTRFLIKFILLSVPALFIAIGSPLMGWYSDRFGRRNLLISATALFALAGVSGALVSSLSLIFLGRALLGLASAGMRTAAFSMSGDLFEGKAREKFVGLQGAAMKIGGFVFLYFGGVLGALHWRASFWGYALAAVALPLMMMVKETKPARSHRQGNADKVRIPVLVTVDIMLAAFTASALFFMIIIQAPFFLPEKFGSSPIQIGFVTGTANLLAAVTAITFHRCRAHLDFPGIFSLIFFLIASGYFLAAHAPTYGLVVVSFAIAGCGFGLIVPAQSSWILASIPLERRGFGIGLVTTAMCLGQFFSPILIQPFIVADDPSAVFVAAANALIVLTLLYGLREIFGKIHRSRVWLR